MLIILLILTSFFIFIIINAYIDHLIRKGPLSYDFHDEDIIQLEINHEFFGDDEKFANYLLLQVHDRIVLFTNFLNKKYSKIDNKRIIEGIYRLNSRYHINKLIENVPSMFNSDTSYTVNKGDILAICLRHRNDLNRFHDMNLISFVVVHELAHIFSIGYGHDDEFWENFKFLLNEAVLCGIYKNINYGENQSYYCGMIVKYNPLFDDRVKSIL